MCYITKHIWFIFLNIDNILCPNVILFLGIFSQIEPLFSVFDVKWLNRVCDSPLNEDQNFTNCHRASSQNNRLWLWPKV